MTIDDLYDGQQNQPEEPKEDDLIVDYLKTKGIEDYQNINFEDEDGNISTRSWDDLSKEEKFNILNTPLETTPTVENPNIEELLSEEEINFLNYLREAKLTPQQYIQQIQGTPTYKIDDLSDDELFILDLESRVGELSDEQAAQALSLAKQNEDLYSKQVQGIRKEYKEREDYESQQSQAQLEQEQQEAFAQYQQNVVNAINSFKSVGNLDLNFEDADKEQLAEFMLSQDESGKNYLYQALQDPETLVKAAWFILNGDEAINGVADYFTEQIKLVSKNQYKKGFEDGQKGKPTVIIDNNKNNNPQQFVKANTIDDLFD